MNQKLLLLYTFILYLLPLSVKGMDYPYGIVPGEKEAPTALFQLDLGDTAVDMFLSGSWDLSLLGTTGLLLKTGAPVQLLDSFPGLTPGLLFQQTPDITLSLWLRELFFFDFTYLGNFENNEFLTGYENPEGNFLKHLYIGNRDVSLPPYPFMDVPEAGNASLGAEALFQTARTEHNLLLRYDNDKTAQKLFIGNNEITEYRFTPAEYQQGRFFKLPDEDVQNLVLYIEDPAGTLTADDQKKYRKADSNDALLDSARGLVSLKNDYNGRLLVYYTKNGLGVGTDDPGLGTAALAGEDADGNLDPDSTLRFYFDMGLYQGEDMAQHRIRLQEDCLLLWEPGSYSPFEILGSYALPAGLTLERWQYRFQVVYRGTYEEKKDLTWPVLFQFFETEQRFQVSHTFNMRDNLHNLYPLPDPAHQLYGANRVVNPSYPDYELLLLIFFPVTEYLLEENIVPGSVRVLRNGSEETAFTVDYTTGKLTFRTYIHPEDRLEIFYKRKEAALYNGDLLFAWGNHIKLDDISHLDLALGVRWNLLPGVYSEVPYSRTGALTASLDYALNTDNFSLKTTGAVSFTNPDTTGKLRLWGMDGTEIAVNIEPANSYPAAVPGLPSASGLTAANRGKLFYKDFREKDILGNITLHTLDWTGYKNYDYTTGSRPGPYPAAGTSAGTAGQSTVIDFEIDTQPGWTGIQVPLTTAAGDTDLTSINALLFSYRAVDVTGEFRVYLQIGAVGEDLDGDSVLDAELSAASPGFPFNDTANNVTLLVGGDVPGTGNYTINSEDFNHNLQLDAENPGKILSLTAPSLIINSTTEEAWQRFSFTLTQDEQKLLSGVRGVRILVVNNGINPCSGKLEIDKIQLQGKTCLTSITGGNGNGETVSAREIPEVYSQSPSPSPIDQQKVLEVSWSSLETAESWEVQKFLSHGLDLLYYKELVVFFRIARLTATGIPELTFSLIDANNHGIRITFQPAVNNDWVEFRADLENRVLYLDDKAVSATVETDAVHSTLTLFKMTMSRSDSGLLYMDELHLKNTQSRAGAGVQLELAAEYPGTLISAGSFPLLGNLIFKESAFAATAGFSSLYGTPLSAFQWNTNTTLAMEILYTGLEMNLAAYNNNSSVIISAGHNLTLPAGKSPVTLTDTFHISEEISSPDTASAPAVTRSNAVTITFNALNSLQAAADTVINETFLVQNWKLTALNGAAGIFRNSFGLTASTSSDTADTPRPAGYFSAWLDAYRYLAPFDAPGMLERKSVTTINPILGDKPLAMDMKAELENKSYAFRETSRTLYNRVNCSLALPLDIDDGKLQKIKITPAYKRELAIISEADTQGDFAGDFAGLFSGIAPHTYFFNQIPFYELYAPAAEAAFEATNSALPDTVYIPECSLSLARNFGSHIYDLFIPSGLDLVIRKTMKKEEDLFNFKNDITLASRTSSLNLFGELGAFPFFKFYAVDEYTNTISCTLLIQKDLPVRAEYSLTNLFSFKGKTENLLRLENTFRFTEDYLYKNNSNLSFEWFIHPETNIKLPFVQTQPAGKSYWSHKEGLQLSFEWTEKEYPIHPFTILLNHGTSLIWPETGFITGKFSLGFDRESVAAGAESDDSVRIAIQGGIEAHFQF